jgi:protoheme ferro-lyase
MDPLRVFIQSQAAKLERHSQQLLAPEKMLIVAHTMIFSGPSLADVVADVRLQGVKHILCVTTLSTIFDNDY